MRERGVAAWGRGAEPPAELSRRCSCSAGMASSAPAAVPTRTSDRIGAYPVRNLCACRPTTQVSKGRYVIRLEESAQEPAAKPESISSS